MQTTQTRTPAFLLAGLILAADLISKAIVVKLLAYGAQLELAPSVNIVHSMNKGAAFGLLSTAGGWQRFLFIGVAVIASALLIWMIKGAKSTAPERMGLAMILGGALGNLVDRVAHSGVVDWIDVYLGSWHWPAFNIADIGITLGAAAIIFCELLGLSHKPSA